MTSTRWVSRSPAFLGSGWAVLSLAVATIGCAGDDLNPKGPSDSPQSSPPVVAEGGDARLTLGASDDEFTLEVSSERVTMHFKRTTPKGEKPVAYLATLRQDGATIYEYNSSDQTTPKAISYEHTPLISRLLDKTRILEKTRPEQSGNGKGLGQGIGWIKRAVSDVLHRSMPSTPPPADKNLAFTSCTGACGAGCSNCTHIDSYLGSYCDWYWGQVDQHKNYYSCWVSDCCNVHDVCCADYSCYYEPTGICNIGAVLMGCAACIGAGYVGCDAKGWWGETDVIYYSVALGYNSWCRPNCTCGCGDPVGCHGYYPR